MATVDLQGLADRLASDMTKVRADMSRRATVVAVVVEVSVMSAAIAAKLDAPTGSGAEGQVLTSIGGVPTWATPPAAGGTSGGIATDVDGVPYIAESGSQSISFDADGVPYVTA